MTIRHMTDLEIQLTAQVKQLEAEQALFLNQKNWIMKSHNQACDARDALVATGNELRESLAFALQERDTLQARVKELEAEVEQVKLDLHAELRGNAAMRMRLGAKDGETMFAFTDRLIAERDTLRQQLSEAQAAIEASRKQKHIAWKHDDFDHAVFQDACPKFPESGWGKLYAAPVVAQLTDEMIATAWLSTSELIGQGERFKDLTHVRAFALAVLDAAMGGAND